MPAEVSSGSQRGAHRLTSEVRGHLAAESLEPGRARSRSGGPPPHSPEVSGRRPRAGSPEPAPPTTPGCSCSHFHKGPAAFVQQEELPSGTQREETAAAL